VPKTDPRNLPEKKVYFCIRTHGETVLSIKSILLYTCKAVSRRLYV
jgi:hypothetical protein